MKPPRCDLLVAVSAAIIVVAGLLPVQSALAQATRPARVEAELNRMIAKFDGTIGLAAVHIDDSRRISCNGGERFPMASTYKVPIAIQMLTRVERGEVDLNSMIQIRQQDLRPGSDLSMLLGDGEPSVTVSLRHLLDLSISISDNTAADRVLAAAGGPSMVTQRMRELAIEDLRVDRSSLQVLLAVGGLENRMSDDSFSWEDYNRLGQEVDPSASAAAERAIGDEPRDSCTPIAMAQLLAKLKRGQTLNEAHTRLLLQLMKRARGSTRIRAMLPPDLPRAAHKSGTLVGQTYRYVNDVGIIELPDGAGSIAIAVFIKRSRASLDDCEAMIAQLSRTVVDHFVLNPGD